MQILSGVICGGLLSNKPCFMAPVLEASILRTLIYREHIYMEHDFGRRGSLALLSKVHGWEAMNSAKSI